MPWPPRSGDPASSRGILSVGSMNTMTRRMTVLACLGALLQISAGDVLAQGPGGAPGRIGTVTRLVKLFDGLENDWLAAIRNRDEAALRALLADDFEMRLASRPADPIPRAEWIKHALATPPLGWTVRQMAARDIGCAVVVSFRLDPGADASGARPALVVDTWVQAQGAWKAVARYVGAADELPLGIPGETMAPGSLPKKY